MADLEQASELYATGDMQVSLGFLATLGGGVGSFLSIDQIQQPVVETLVALPSTLVAVAGLLSIIAGLRTISRADRI